ncbi:hypothetical protein FXE63_13660 [Vibrio mimicus]|uniref:hypothetical protein n=1 Tax=Vibrio mimicus TaxID=674 RepID=UPI0011D3A57D|nr:hypothetical protein [Vibrio mimicus]TXZ06991.1 hypothetical protein FXE63_13660 [Vibrio mimicus]
MKKKNYKIALQFFGHLRSYRKTLPYQIAHIISEYNCDIFIHTWETEEHNDPTWHKSALENESISITSRQDLIECYHPVALEIEDNSIVVQQGYFNGNNNILLRSMKAMFHSQQKVNKLRREYSLTHSIDYDFVITLRPDVMPLCRLNLDDYIQEFEFAEHVCIHFSNGAHQHSQVNKKIYTPLASDIFYISTPKTIDNIFNDNTNFFNRFYIDFNKVNIGGISAPEASFNEMLLQCGVISRFYEFPYAVVRTTGNNHLKVSFESIGKFEQKIDMPTYLQGLDGKEKKSSMYKLFSKLSNERIGKIQKEIDRFKRQLDTFSDWLKQIKESR